MRGDFLFKIILAGSGGCGKTTLMTRYTTGAFTSNTKMTIGVDFAIHHLKLPGVGKITLQIWDFGGEERFREMLPSFCLGASGCLLFFDLLRPHTFHELDEWIKIIRDNTNDIPIILLGTKYDLIESEEEISISQDLIDEFMKNNNIKQFLYVSSKTGLNVKESFEGLSKLMLETQNPPK